MASVGMAHNQVEKGGANSMFVDKLPEGVNEMTIKDDKVKKVAAFFFLEVCFCIYWGWVQFSVISYLFFCCL